MEMTPEQNSGSKDSCSYLNFYSYNFLKNISLYPCKNYNFPVDALKNMLFFLSQKN